MGPVHRPSIHWLVVLTAISSLLLWITPPAAASELVDLQPLTERILMLHFNDGHVQHHQRGEPLSPPNNRAKGWPMTPDASAPSSR